MSEHEIVIESKSKQLNIMIDASVLNTFEKCPTLMKYQYIDHLKLRGIKNRALEKGDLLHIALKHYYRNKKAQMEWSENTKFCFEKIYKYSPKLALEDKEVKDVASAFLSYCEFNRFEKWEVVEVERPFRIVVYEDAEIRIIFQGKIDLIVDTGQIVAPVDHKSESRRDNDPSELSNQFEGYCYAAKSNNLIVNKIGFQTSLAASEKYYRDLMSYSDDNIEEWREELIFKVKELIGYAEVNWFPHRYSSCKDKYGKCMFHDVCKTPRFARDVKINTLFEVGDPWNPFRDLEAEEN